MKKAVLTSLLAVFAVSGAHAANVINNNPLYRPMKGQAYSVTDLGATSQNTSRVVLGEELGYGLTDNLAAIVTTSASESDWFDNGGWDHIGVGLNYRAVDWGNWKADIFGAYNVMSLGTWGDEDTWFEKDMTDYKWTAGVRAGYATAGWTVAGHVALDYYNSESFNWDDSGLHMLRFGLDGQLVLNSEWNLIAGVEYNANYDNWSDNVGYWTGKLGANFNFDDDKFLGAYITKTMDHNGAGNWEVDDGFGFGATFGIQF